MRCGNKEVYKTYRANVGNGKKDMIVHGFWRKNAGLVAEKVGCT